MSYNNKRPTKAKEARNPSVIAAGGEKMPASRSPAVIMQKIRLTDTQVIQHAAKEKSNEKNKSTASLHHSLARVRAWFQAQTEAQSRTSSLAYHRRALAHARAFSLVSQTQSMPLGRPRKSA
ncbi:hypothetical protein BGX23_005816 [Mortierella sp. AD031]|nr:hypothetical protein BGX23_005816 [Mortierella sp. AD031]